MQLIVGGVGNGAAEGRLALGFKPRHGTDEGAFWDHAALAKVGTHAALGCALFATWLRKQERLYLEKKDSCWWTMRRCHMVLN